MTSYISLTHPSSGLPFFFIAREGDRDIWVNEGRYNFVVESRCIHGNQCSKILSLVNEILEKSKANMHTCVERVVFHKRGVIPIKQPLDRFPISLKSREIGGDMYTIYENCTQCKEDITKCNYSHPSLPRFPIPFVLSSLMDPPKTTWMEAKADSKGKILVEALRLKALIKYKCPIGPTCMRIQKIVKTLFQNEEIDRSILYCVEEISIHTCWNHTTRWLSLRFYSQLEKIVKMRNCFNCLKKERCIYSSYCALASMQAPIIDWDHHKF